MITKEKFVEIIKLHLAQDAAMDKLQELDIQAFESPLVEFGFLMFENLIEHTFNIEGRDWIFWWLYEKKLLGDGPSAINDDGSELPTETIEDLWNIVEKYRI